MIESKMNDIEKVITISINGVEKLKEYEQGIRALLSKIEVGSCDPKLRHHVTIVYELLTKLLQASTSHGRAPSKVKSKMALHHDSYIPKT